MLEADLHSHSHFSLCGIHSVVELLTEARRKGLKVLAVTDHGPSTGGRCVSTFFDRLDQPVEGITLLKGIESNPVGTSGSTDVPDRLIRHMDIVLLGFHYNLPKRNMKTNTKILLRILRLNPFVDLITHPGNDGFALDFPVICAEAARLGVALELNNSKLLLGRQGTEEMERLIGYCLTAGCRVAVSSDAHALQEIGGDEQIRPLLKKAGYPEELIVNRTAAAALEFVAERRKNKRSMG